MRTPLTEEAAELRRFDPGISEREREEARAYLQYSYALRAETVRHANTLANIQSSYEYELRRIARLYPEE